MAQTGGDVLVDDRASDRSAPVGIVAGGGAVPVFLAGQLAERGESPFVVLLQDDADPALTAHPHAIHGTAQIGAITSALRRAGCRRVVLLGTVQSRPEIRQIRPNLTMIRFAMRYLRARLRGDDAILRMVISILQDEGFNVVGAHELVPDLLAPQGQIGAVPVAGSHRRAVETGIEAALSLGRLDAGQAVVAIGQRVVALEGAEGTDAMIDRIAHLRAIGRLTSKPGGVLVKLRKPGQDMRVDLPTIGVRTVERAKAAELSGIVVHAENTLIHDQKATIAAADAAGVFLFGLEPGTTGARGDG